MENICCKPSIVEVEKEGSGVQRQPRLFQTLSQKQKVSNRSNLSFFHTLKKNCLKKTKQKVTEAT